MDLSNETIKELFYKQIKEFGGKTSEEETEILKKETEERQQKTHDEIATGNSKQGPIKG